jgi:hypothetical protein
VGTSVSNRSPDTPRWRAVRSAYLHGLPEARIASEIAHAAQSWRGALSSPAVGAYLSAVVTSFDAVPTELEHRSPDAVVRGIADAAYDAAVASSGDLSGLPIAERALQRTLISCLRADRLISETPAEEAAATWMNRRGAEPRDLATHFVGEVLDQFSRHVVARDVGGLIGGDALPNPEAARALGGRIAATVATQAMHAFAASAAETDVREAWHFAIESTFSRPERS